MSDFVADGARLIVITVALVCLWGIFDFVIRNRKE